MDEEQKKGRPDRERIEALMPWIRRGQLTEADSVAIDDELARFPELASELAAEENLSAALAAIAADEEADAAGDADEAWAKFQGRLASVEDARAREPKDIRLRSRSSARSSSWRSPGLPRSPLAWLAAGQTAALAALAFLFLPAQLATNNEEYHTLSSGEGTHAPIGNAVMVLEPATDLATMRSLLGSAKARIVDGPMANGGYVIAIEDAELDTGIETLRASERVLLVEKLGGGDQP